MAVLDTILIEELVLVPTTVNSEFVTRSVDLMNRENEFSIQTVYNNGVNVDMRIVLEVSNDNVNFSEVEDSSQVISDSEGSDIMDIGFCGTNYLRVKIEVTGGSIDVQRLVYAGKRRH